MKRLYRSRKNKVLAGVCGGIGEYFEIDPVLVRLIWIVFSLLWGFGILLYIIAILVIPLEPKDSVYSENEQQNDNTETEHHKHIQELEDSDRKTILILIAALLIVVGILIVLSMVISSTFFFRNFVKIVLSVLLIGIGAYLISKSRTKK
ncbi:PspC domain-containing protein [Petrotoga sp. 9PWA.NaAc.5.4]|uniref:PspC domain-containing protein n=1 Tax=Petrotoga sp. 9PWA.NaAc.5.4 TaxID=1434328 RepID=UPI000CA866E8|nr:PspC domain-containing protein [Petrotoga sp. 9PWA.NaAc.5.4]PNR96723.1 phage-shock protein [Petrotoga sp. 9PWA.NaAc.5.4]